MAEKLTLEQARQQITAAHPPDPRQKRDWEGTLRSKSTNMPEEQINIPKTSLITLKERFQDALIAEVKEHHGIPELSKEEMIFREFLTQFFLDHGLV